MKLVFTRYVTVFCISILIGNAAVAAPIHVPLKDVIANPSQFNGRVVSVTGYLDTTAAHTCDLRVAKARPDDIRALVNIQLPKTSYAEINRITHDHRQLALIRITGVFQYKDLSLPREKGIGEQSRTPQVIRIPTGFGWMGLYDKQITRISSIEAASSEENIRF
jgi:hypothetical protein